MSTSPLRLAVVIGSVREGRFGPLVAQWFAEQARRHGGFEVDLVDLAESPLPLTLPDFGGEPDAATAVHHSALAQRLAAADAFVFVTAEYNHSFPASLKNALDWFREEWQAKAYGLVSYGGQAGGVRAAEHLRTVICELHGMTVRDALSFHNAWELFGEDGRADDDGASDAAAKAMLGQLGWWGGVLREARAQSPYQAL
ncbi:NAD(P)H-dependent oxidoreductase [Streptomyces sp. P9(2023)]|uniref:NADPH-dependent FMN reductase n=1 Tax=Streptomyces sp. P9(2023) TaxID=3064394 RepID=UPI0028F427C3|nr:NAD(P)H-dependent oxidoreductase [Streptomyces sp. P9(2023)]MDT9691523.1 NAD(P)H-dependent oxidoreductase [Streptomyces sp. P9(2023)]